MCWIVHYLTPKPPPDPIDTKKETGRRVMIRECSCGSKLSLFEGGQWPQPAKPKFRVSQPDIRSLDVDAVAEALHQGWVGPDAPQVRKFEEGLTERLGQPCLAVSNGSVAIILALKALGIGPGDEVIVPALTYAASASSVLHTGATPVFVDVDPKTWCLTRDSVALHLGSRTRAIIAVNLYGVSGENKLLRELCDERGIALIEDSAENFSGLVDGRFSGTWGHIGTFSFFANKTLAVGEGGAVTSDDEELLERMRLLRGQGMSSDHRYYFDAPGFNFRMPAMTAALGSSLLARLDEAIKRRLEIESEYHDRLGDLFVRPEPRTGSNRAPWIYTATLRIGNPVGLARHLSERGIETRPVFVPMGLMVAFEGNQCTGCNKSLSIHERGLSLPTYNLLSSSDVRVIALEVKEWFGSQL